MRTDPQPFKRNIWLLFFITLFSFTYFSQGGGHNQNSTIGEIKSFIESGDVTIEEWQSIDKDISIYNGKVFSNKSPSVLFFASIPYAVFYYCSVTFGVDTTSAQFQLLSIQFITFFVSVLWGALLSVLLVSLIQLLWPKITPYQAIFLAYCLSLSTMLFPYSTVGFLHVFESYLLLLLVLLWCRLWKNPSKKYAIILGLTLGASFLANSTNICIVTFVILSLALNKNIRKYSIYVGCACFVALLPLWIYATINFGSPFRNNRFYQIHFSDSRLFLGVFDTPDLSRLIKVLFWSNRAFLPSQPLVLVGLFILLRRHLLRFPLLLSKDTLPAIIITCSFAFMLTFNGWHGGNCYGPRYMLPAMILLSVYSIGLYIKMPKLFLIIMGISYSIIFAVTVIDVMPGIKNETPLATILTRFFSNDFPDAGYPSFPNPYSSFYKFNLASLLGLSGLLSVLPLALIQLVGFWHFFRLSKKTNSSCID